MKKCICVFLFVLVTVTLISFVGCKHDGDPEPANFVGEWRSTDGSATVTIDDGKFTTAMGGLELKGTYTVDGNTATTSKVQIPGEMTGGQTVSVSFTMKMVDGNDVMKLTVPAELTGDKPFDMTFVKKSTTKPDLTGTWTGKVDLDGKGTLGEVRIVFTGNTATLTMVGETFEDTVEQEGNFFSLVESGITGMISASGKAYIADGSVFTKQ